MFRGIMTPVVTPLNGDGSIALGTYSAHCQWVLENGSHYVTPFGTNGEALSFGKRQRMDAVEALVRNGIAPGQMMPGTGLTSLEDTAELTGHATQMGCAACMILPPFFFRQASDEGMYVYFARLIELLGASAPNICLYHIPQVAGIGFSLSLVLRLRKAFPDVIVAIKDSSGDWSNTVSYIDQVPGLDVFPGSETFLLQGQRSGAAGCISGTCNVNPAAVRAVFDNAANKHVEGLNDEMLRVRQLCEGAGLMPACKWLLAESTGDPAYGRVQPPLLPIGDAKGKTLKTALGPSFDGLAGHVKPGY